jgi:hypothetical protein
LAFCLSFSVGLYSYVGRHRVAHNVLQLGEVADLEAQKFNFALMFIRNPNIQFSTEPAILPNRCCAFVLF